MSKLRKCGEFMEKDGIVVKRPGKKFVCPPMPAKMRITYHKNEHMREIDNTEEMNALKEIRWRRVKKNEYLDIKRLYYFQQIVRFVQKTAAKIIKVISSKETKKTPVKADVYTSVCLSRDS